MPPESCFALTQRKMCSKGTVSARDSFVYISEAVLSNHGAAPETNHPENMQCLTVSKINFLTTLCPCLYVKLQCEWMQININCLNILKSMQNYIGMIVINGYL